MKHPNDATPEPLKMSQSNRDKITCAYCGASSIHNVLRRDQKYCGICGNPWKSKFDKEHPHGR